MGWDNGHGNMRYSDVQICVFSRILPDFCLFQICPYSRFSRYAHARFNIIRHYVNNIKVLCYQSQYCKLTVLTIRDIMKWEKSHENGGVRSEKRYFMKSVIQSLYCKALILTMLSNAFKSTINYINLIGDNAYIKWHISMHVDK